MSATTFSLEAILPSEYTRLVRLCAYLTGDPDAAEDLAQETMIEAWRNRHKLVDPQGYPAWLSAIARNVCLRWKRKGRQLARRTEAAQRLEADATDDFDIEIELEHHDLVTLLDRALALLPPETRVALIKRYVEEWPLAEVAARLGVSEGAVAVRIHRGKLTLSRLLLTEFRHEAAEHGLILSEHIPWQQTRVWCPDCGQNRLHGSFNRSEGKLTLRCPVCPGPPFARHGRSPVRGVDDPVLSAKGFKTALAALTLLVHDLFKPGLGGNPILCWICGRPVVARIGHFEAGQVAPRAAYGMMAHCEVCGNISRIALSEYSLGLPDGQRFWRNHPKIRVLPERQIEADGQPAILTGYQSLTDPARFETVFTYDSFTALASQVKT